MLLKHVFLFFTILLAPVFPALPLDPEPAAVETAPRSDFITATAPLTAAPAAPKLDEPAPHASSKTTRDSRLPRSSVPALRHDSTP